MTLDGYIHGYVLPPLMAHNMDDPRSDHCEMKRTGVIGDTAALTARKRGFATPEAYADWIRADARSQLDTPFEDDLRRAMRARDPSILARIRRRLTRLAGRSG